ncbi:MAG: hypothetical protein LBQ36_06230 [Synergistaceae bacterium]|nr:hypothetical protein [Synergistaceae bacterium]
MRKLLATLMLACGVFGAAASHAGAPIHRNNVLTASHVSIAGTHVSLVPPKGAVQSSSFTGFEMPDLEVRIRITESNGVSYKEAESMLTPEGVEALGIKFSDKSPVTLNSIAGTLVTGVSASNGDIGALLLVTGGDRFSTHIVALYPKADKSIETLCRNSLLSCIFNQSAVSSVSGNYSLSANGTSLKFADEVGSTRYFTLNGQPVGNALETALYTSTVSNEGVMRGNWDAYADSAMSKFMSGYEHSVVSRRNVNYGGLPGIETVAEFDGAMRRTRTASGASVQRATKGKGYQAVLFDEDQGKVFIFSGIAVRDADSYLSQFLKISASFSPK